MPNDPEIRVAITANAGAAKAAIEDFATRGASAVKAFQAAANESGKAANYLNDALTKLSAQNVAMVPAMERALASWKQLQGAEDQDTLALRANTATRREAIETMYVMQGSAFGAARAIGDFASQIPAVGTLITAAFSGVVVLAFAEMIGRAAAGVAKFASEAGALGRELGTGWLDGAIAEVAGLGKEIKQADDEIMKLAADQDRIRGEQQAAAVERVRLTQGEAAADYAKAAQLQQQIDALEKLRALDTARGKSLDAKASMGREPSAEGYEVTTAGIAAVRKQEDEAHADYVTATKQEMLLIEQKNNLYLEAQKAQAEADKKAARPEQREEAQVRGAYLSSVFEKMRQRNHALEADTRSTQEQISANAKREADDVVRAADRERRAQEEALQAYRDKARQLEENTRSQEQQISAAKSMADARINGAEQRGSMSRVASDQARAAVETKAYADQIEALKNELAQLTPFTQEYIRVQQQLNQVQSQAAVAQANNRARLAQDMAQPYVNAMNTINSAWLNVQNKLIYGTRSVAEAFNNMGVSILESGAAWVERWLVQRAEAYLRDRIFHQVSEQAKVAQQEAAAAQSQAITSTTNAAQAVSYSAVATTGAASAVAFIPIVGPALAAAAAVSMQAMLAPFVTLAAFETGGIIPNTGVALVHQGEAVLPKTLTTMLTSVANNNQSSSSSSTSFHSTNNFNGINDRNFRDMARRNSEVVADAVHRAIRSGRKVA